MARRMVPSSFECDCGHQSHFCEGIADTNGCTCWIQRPRNTLSSSRKEWQLRLFVRSRGGAKSPAGLDAP